MISERIVRELKDVGVNLFVTLPCEKVRSLINRGSQSFRHIALTSEEEGVGICAGASLAGAKPAMLIQSSGVGRIVNAICSLVKVYELPLLVLVSWRGVYKERIPAQVPLGKRLPEILSSIDIGYSSVETPNDIHSISVVASKAYMENMAHAILLNPRIWEDESAEEGNSPVKAHAGKSSLEQRRLQIRALNRVLTRFDVLKTVSPYLEGRIVVCNLGIPCKELYHVKHQKSNFYMLGSMGLASAIGLGIASFTAKDVVVIDGDGSLLMNLGTLSTIAVAKPRNLTILAIDNTVHGSTGNQPTATSFGADLELLARGAGFDKTYRVADKVELASTVRNLKAGPNFVHILAKAGNAAVSNVPLTPTEIRKNVIEAIQE